MKILALETSPPGTCAGAFTPDLLRAEALQVWDLYQAGTIRELYFREDRRAAVLILECGSAAEASAVLATLPLVRAGLIAFEIVLLVAYPGFERLFER